MIPEGIEYKAISLAYNTLQGMKIFYGPSSKWQ